MNGKNKALRFPASLMAALFLLLTVCAAESAPQTVPDREEQPFLIQITPDDPSIAYVLVQIGNTAGLLPLPLEGEYTKTIRQVQSDGTEMINVLRLTPEGFCMESSNCPGHDCIGEGTVTLENRWERIMWNMVVCLPHQLFAQLITREEAEKLLGY